MTILDEGRRIASEVAKLRPDKRRRYTDELRGRILDWVDRATRGGITEPECSKLLRVKTWRFVTWRRALAREAGDAPAPLALVPITVTPSPAAAPSAVAFVTPSGYRLEGLTLAQAVALLQEVA
jgi:hypothetical protein